MRLARRDEVHELIAPLIAAKTTEHWLQTLDAIGVPVSAIQDFATVAAEPQLAHRQVFVEQAHHLHPNRSVKVVRAAHVAEPGNPSIQGPTPTLGEHTDEILAELGYSVDQVKAMHNDGVV